MKIENWTILGLLIWTNSFAATPTSDRPVALINAKSVAVAIAMISKAKSGVKIRDELKGLTPGMHAIHFHEKGDCQAPSFASAGGHFEPMKHKHGFYLKDGPHAGDMHNIMVASDGTAKIEIVNTRVTLGKDKFSLLKEGGTALVIHQKQDDYKTQPSGDAGDRLLCGEIK